MSDFHKGLMSIAFAHAKMSDDPSTKVGAVIALDGKLVSWGYNHIACGIEYTSQMMEDRTWKYPRIVHAETSALLNLGSDYHSLNCHMYVTHHPCEHCASLMIDFGIKKVFTNPVTLDIAERWPGMKIASEMFKEAGVSVNFQDI